MSDRIKDPHRGFRGIARHDHHFDEALIGQGIQFQQGPHQRKTGAELQDLVFVLELMIAVGIQAIGAKDRFLGFQIEQGARRDTND